MPLKPKLLALPPSKTRGLHKSSKLVTAVCGVCLAAVLCANGAVIWSDEFSDTTINRAHWTYDVGGWGFGNGQFEYNTARSENSYVTNGSLVIEARRESYLGNSFTSARMVTQGRFAFKYGILEARIKMPNTANGLWPAFWMMGNNAGAIAWPGCGELDIVELGSKQGIAEGAQQRKMNCALHYSNLANTHSMLDAWTNAPVDLSLDFHTYKMSWTPSAITFYLDDAEYASWDITGPDMTEFHQPFFALLNIAIGGYNPSYTGVYDPAAVTATFPARMYVDWIRLHDNDYTQVFQGAPEENGNFGVYAESASVSRTLTYQTGLEPEFEYGTNAALYIWNNMIPATPPGASEGNECWSFDIAGGAWFGMGVLVPNFRNMIRYSDGYLHFDIKTTGTAPLKVGIKSSRGGEFWLPLGVDQTSEFGFARDGQWHTVSLPLNRFANIDFRTIHQFFMIAGDPSASAMNLSIDHVWWAPGSARLTPAGGTFGVFTESALHKTAGEFVPGTHGNFFIWENTLVPRPQSPAEGTESISLQSAPGPNWFGAAFTPNIKYDLSAFTGAGSKLCFSMKTTSAATFMVGMKSGNMDGVGQKWITFQQGADPYGFVRDGQWHTVEVPVSQIAAEVDFTEVSQLFQVLGVNGPITNIELDDIYFSSGAPLKTNVAATEIVAGVSIRWPTLAGRNYIAEWTAEPGANWNPLGPVIPGDGETNSVFEPILSQPGRFYRIRQQP